MNISLAMRTHWKLTLKTERLRRKGNYLDLTATDELTAVRCITGSFKSFAHSFGAPVAYTPSTFRPALDMACEAFRKEYTKQKSDHFKGSNGSIIGRFVQVILHSDGMISSFTYGGSTVVLLREGTPQPIQPGEITAQKGDLVVINLEGESTTQKLIENGGLNGIENDYPLLVFQIEREGAEALFPAQRVAEIPVEVDIPALEKAVPLTEGAVYQPAPGHSEEIREESVTGRKNIWMGWAALIVGLGLGAWMGYPYMAHNLPDLSGAFYSGGSDSSQKDANEKAEAGTWPSTQSLIPKTDSLLKIYYAKNPRELPLLDQAIQTLEQEQGVQNPGVPGTLQADLLKERNEMVNQLKTTFNEYLSQAQIAMEEGKLTSAREYLAKAQKIFSSSLKKAINDDAEIKSIERDLINRVNKIENLQKKDSVIF